MVLVGGYPPTYCFLLRACHRRRPALETQNFEEQRAFCQWKFSICDEADCFGTVGVLTCAAEDDTYGTMHIVQYTGSASLVDCKEDGDPGS